MSSQPRLFVEKVSPLSKSYFYNSWEGGVDKLIAVVHTRRAISKTDDLFYPGLNYRIAGFKLLFKSALAKSIMLSILGICL